VGGMVEWGGRGGVEEGVGGGGRGETMEAAFRAVRDGGGLCVLAGNLPAGEQISINPMDLIRGKRIAGTWGGESQPDRDIPLYGTMYLAGKLRLERLISHEYPLADINRAFDDLEQGQGARALIDIGR